LLSTTDDLEESHYYKGLALRAQGHTTEARAEFQAALKWNKNYQDAQKVLADSK
jgi:Tfp pilus assembly protein PilF